VPRTFAGLGPDSLVPLAKPAALASLKLSAEEGFVLSRVDGKLTIAQVCMLVPFDPEVTATIIGQLARAGALVIPNSEIPEALAPLQPKEQTAPPPQQRGEAPNAMMDGLDLTVEQARRIDEWFASLDRRDAFELLELPRGSDKKEVQRAYFRLFHPDRFFNRNIGPYRERLSKVFQSIKSAFELLSDDARRAAYEDSTK
jgi:hypothetical protein